MKSIHIFVAFFVFHRTATYVHYAVHASVGSLPSTSTVRININNNQDLIHHQDKIDKKRKMKQKTTEQLNNENQFSEIDKIHFVKVLQVLQSALFLFLFGFISYFSQVLMDFG